ncbi:MAG: hypothetical protein CMH49_02470 [Myxococcales bacterium]|nr:hypothetical protein [Myxococcales bacterium]
MYLILLTFLGIKNLLIKLLNLYPVRPVQPTLSIVLLFSLSLPYSCVQQEQEWTEQQKQKGTQRERAVPVEVHRLTLGTVRSTVKAVSILSPKEKASVRSLISGLLTELYVAEGDRVKAKQSLAMITRPGAKSLIRKAAGLYRKSKHDVQQLQSLVKKGLAPREELTQAKFNRDQSAIELTRLREEAKNETLRSPIAGVVVRRPLYQGETVSPGQAIFEIMDLSQIYAPLNLPDRWSTMIYEGMQARLYDREGQLLSAQAIVSHVSPIIDANTGTFSVWVSPKLTTPPKNKRKRSHKKNRTNKIQHQFEINSKLKPGLFVGAEITIGEHKNVLVIPREAVIYKDGNAQVSVVKNDRITIVDVTIGYQEAQVLEIISPLKVGDAVVTFGQRGLESGTLVKAIWPKNSILPSSSSKSVNQSTIKKDLEKSKKDLDAVNSSMKR